MTLLPQIHTHYEFPIWYDSYDIVVGMQQTIGVTPPTIGRHREAWPYWGKYTFIPPQRWMHSLEHGGIVFLYNNCLSAHSIHKIQHFISTLKHTFDTEYFRYILTPFLTLRTNVAIIAWGTAFLTNCFFWDDWREFMNNNYKRSWEDISHNGNYRFLYEQY